jgi:hypothetical protein
LGGRFTNITTTTPASPISTSLPIHSLIVSRSTTLGDFHFLFTTNAAFSTLLLTLRLLAATDKMGEATIVASNWRLVEVGRIVLIQGNGPFTGRLAAIVEIIDHKRVRQSGFSSSSRKHGLTG